MERRVLEDRRRRATSLPSALAWGGQRAGFRRRIDGSTGYVDVARPATLWLTLFIAIASAFDAFFTLVHLGRGAREANPVMQFALDHGVGWFLFCKVGLTSLGIAFLIAHQLTPLSFKSLRIISVAYAVLLAYHVGILILH